jgi:pyroglutamyl-peptidase
MTTVLLTAFDAYDCWTENSSWLTLMELTKTLPAAPRITTRRYAVELSALRQRLTSDLAANYDYVLHLGQAPGHSCIHLEAVGINVNGAASPLPEDLQPLAADGPVAYRSLLPLAKWASKLRRAGIPSNVSYHAGTYLCNAALYLTHYVAERQHLKTRGALLHLPLETSQVLNGRPQQPSLPRSCMAAAIRLILEELADGDRDSAGGSLAAKIPD